MMDCREFQDLAVDLATGRLREAALAELARAHAAECQSCARRLAAEVQLAVQLGVLKSEESSIQAPAYLQAALLTEFQKLHAPGPESGVQETIPRQPQTIRLPRPISQSKLAWWSIAAAAAVALAVWSGYPREAPGRGPITAQAPEALSGAPESNPPLQQDSSAIQHSPATTEQPSTSPHQRRDEKQGNDLKNSRAHAQPVRVARKPEQTTRTNPQPRQAVFNTAGASMTADNANQEFVTEFVPLTFANQASRPSEVRLVRVKLPSTALAYFGLPAAPGATTVEADVIVGDDGMAQALRFVRPAAALAGFAGTANSRELQRD